jgi:hypothetical protein
MFNNLMLESPSPAMLRVIADQLERENTPSAHYDEEPRVKPSTPESVVSSTTQENPLGHEGSVFATTVPKKRGRPPKNPALDAETPDPEILPPEPVAVKPVVTMPNGVVLNAPEPAPVVAAEPTLAQAVADYAKAFQIAGLSALAKREGVSKFSELPAERQTVLIREMTDAVSLGVAAA